MKYFKKITIVLVCLCAIIFTSIVASAAVYSNSVDLVRTKSAAYSDKHFAYGGYINSTTECHDVSTQRMRAQFEYRVSYSLDWISDRRIFVDIGSSASTFSSSQFTSGKHFRLALSPESGDSGAQGVGIIYYNN